MASPERQLPHESNEQFRARMRASGMKLVQIWVPDPASPEFMREAQRQTSVIADSPEDKMILRLSTRLPQTRFSGSPGSRSHTVPALA